jgi:hypothetical protein
VTYALTRLYIWLATLLVCSGWLLSVVGQVNRGGYAIVGLFALGIVVWWVRSDGEAAGLRRFAPLRRRLRRPFVQAFCGLALLALLGALLYAPSNYDALAYRVPRTLHWLAEERWHWIHTFFHRMNTRGQGGEWIMAPLLLFARSEALAWVPNFAAFCALPGLTFGALRGAGVGGRAAWHWMWILPCGYAFLLQAGSLGNDLPCAFLVVAAVALAVRARTSRAVRDVWCSLLALALASGMEISNAPFALVWLVAVWPALPLLRARIGATAALVPVAALVSFLPCVVLNAHYGGDWSGATLEMGPTQSPKPWAAVSGNALGLLFQNLTPPVFPLAGWWNAHVFSWLPAGLMAEARTTFESGGGMFTVSDMQTEEGAGIGFGVTLLLLISAVAGCCVSRNARKTTDWNALALRWAPWAALGVHTVKVVLLATARVATPYYLLLAAGPLSASGMSALTRCRWWRGLAGAQFALAGLLVVISPARPLWPALTVLNDLSRRHPESALIARMRTVYQTYRNRPDAMASVREAVPREVTVLGLVTGDDLETSLWRPFGVRRCEHIIPGDTRAMLDARGVTWLAVNDDNFRARFPQPLAEWAASLDGELVQTIPVAARATRGPVGWHLIRLRPPAPTPKT